MPQPRTGDGDKVVVAFRPGAVRVRPPAPGRETERGTILLFTGVRYQRLPDEAAFLAAIAPGCAGPPEERIHS